MSIPNLNEGLSVAELIELQAFLDQDELQGRAMDVAMIEGFAAAIIVGPTFVMPSRWLAWVWDAEEGTLSPTFDSTEQANRVMNLLMRHYNGVAQAFMAHPPAFEPMFQRDARWNERSWCSGFMVGMDFAETQWLDLQRRQLAWFTPFVMLGDDEELTPDTIEGGYVQRWREAIAPTLVKMHAHWRAERERRPAGLVDDHFHLGDGRMPVRREAPKTGRNDACPCGSGRKFKKCCGGGRALH